MRGRPPVQHEQPTIKTCGLRRGRTSADRGDLAPPALTQLSARRRSPPSPGPLSPRPTPLTNQFVLLSIFSAAAAGSMTRATLRRRRGRVV